MGHEDEENQPERIDERKPYRNGQVLLLDTIDSQHERLYTGTEPITSAAVLSASLGLFLLDLFLDLSRHRRSPVPVLVLLTLRKIHPSIRPRLRPSRLRPPLLLPLDMRGDSACEVLVPLDGRQGESLTAPGDGTVNAAFPLLDQFFDRAAGEGVRADGPVSTTTVAGVEMRQSAETPGRDRSRENEILPIMTVKYARLVRVDEHAELDRALEV